MPRETLSARVDRVESGISELKATTQRMEARLNRIDLNGHTEKLKAFLDDTAPKLESLADNGDTLIAIAQGHRDRLAFRRVLKEALPWRVLLLVGATIPYAYLAINAILTALGKHS